MAKVNPFNPNSPVNPGMFVGRVGEIVRLDSHLIQTRAGQPANFMITGERGIGKSSLLLYLRAVAQGLIPIGGSSVRFLVVFTDVDRTTTQLGLIKRIELAIRRELEKTEPARQFMATAWEFIKRIEAGGVRLTPEGEPKTDEVLLDQFTYALSDIVSRVCDKGGAPAVFGAEYDGVLILIDEADNAPASLDLGTFLKLLSERLQRQGCNRVMIGLAGLPGLREVMAQSHPSALRMFDEVILDRLSKDEAGDVIDRCIASANQLDQAATAIDPEAKSTLIAFSEGFPHFLQQFGYSAFAADTDDRIDKDDVYGAAIAKGGAMELIGDRYYRDNFYTRIQAEGYRQVLRIMAGKFDQWVTKAEIRAKFEGKQSILDNAIQALRERGIILSKEGERGVYRLQHIGFAIWIRLYTTPPQELQDSMQASASEAAAARSGDSAKASLD